MLRQSQTSCMLSKESRLLREEVAHKPMAGRFRLLEMPGRRYPVARCRCGRSTSADLDVATRLANMRLAVNGQRHSLSSIACTSRPSSAFAERLTASQVANA